MPEARAVIEAIQRDRGFEPAERGGTVVRSPSGRNQRDLGNALKLLSDQLYNSDGHFLLELLQNADDNTYAPGVEPTVIIEIGAAELVLRNNEVGFSEANVEALCSVGESTKKHQKAETTGEKGIGFKAVFKVSDRPEVHSGGFSFCFDRVLYGDLGLVTPRWLETTGRDPPSAGTTIILPYKSTYQPSADLQSQLRPELLLFLRRVRRLRVVDGPGGVATELRRRGDGPIVEVVRSVTSQGATASTTHRFFRHSRKVSVGDLHDELRPDIAHTDVVVAAALNDNGTVDGSSPRHLFAFLPVRESGLRFVAHADFILNTSREDVMRQRPWNLRLRDDLGLATAEVVQAIQQDAGAGRTALRMLSKPSGVPDTFIQPILERAIAALKSAPCIPVLMGGWSVPDKALRHDLSNLSELIPAEESGQLIGKSLLDDGVTLISDALDLLKVSRFQLADLLKACANTDWVTKRTPAWFADLYRRLEPVAKSDDAAKQLHSAAILRLGDGSVAPATKRGVFRSLSRKTTYGFEEQLSILDAAVLHEAKGRSWLEAVDAFLHRLGVRDADPAAIIEKHILRTHAESAGKIDVATLLGHGKYLREHLEHYLNSKGEGKDSALKSLRDTFWVLTAQRDGEKRFVRHGPDMYLGDAYGDPNKLQSLFDGSIDDDVVASDYASDNTPKVIDAWRSMFTRLGVHTLPRVIRSEVPPNHVQPPPTYRGCPAPTVEDWLPAEEFADLIDAQDPERKLALVALLDRYWLTRWKQYSKCEITRAYLTTEGASSLLEKLRAMEVPDSRGDWLTLAGLYQPTDYNREVFGGGVRYLKAALSSSELIDAVGVVLEPTVEQVLARLSEMASEGSADKKAAGKLYRFLEEHWEEHETLITEYFRDHAVVAVKSGETMVWAQSADCCWQVPARLRDAAPLRGLVGVWPQFEEFFCDRLNVRRSLSREEWVATLLKLSDLELELSEAGDLARQVYRELEELLRADVDEENGEVPDWFSPVVEGLGVLTTKGEWCGNGGEVFANDDPVVASLFEDSDTVAFIDISPVDLPRFTALLKALGIPLVSNADRVPLNNGDRREAQGLADHLHTRWPAVARLLFHRHQAWYKEAKSDGRLLALRSIAVSAWVPLLLEVVLHTDRRQHRFECKLRVDTGGLELLVDADEQDNWPAIGLELGHFLGLDESASSVVGLVLGAKNETAVEKLLRTYHVHELPSGELDALLHGESAAVAKGDSESPNEGDEDQGEEDEELGQEGEADTKAVASGHKRKVADSNGGDADQEDADAKAETSVNDDGAGGRDRSVTQAGGAAGDGSVGATDPKDLKQHRGSQQGTSGEASAPGANASRSDPASSNGSRRKGGAPPTTPDLPSTGERKPQRSPGRLISYVAPPEGADRDAEGDDEAQSQRDRTNLAAVAYVVLKEKEENRRAEVREHTNPGYDIESFGATGESDRFIEVKGLKGAWGERGVTMTPTQFEFAKQLRHRSWLYIVEFADEPARRKLWRVRDPAAKVMKFGFDHGWQGVAELAPPPAPPGAALKAGAKWQCDDNVVGTIESVKRSSSFVSVRVARPDGTTVSRTGPEELLLRSIVGD